MGKAIVALVLATVAFASPAVAQDPDWDPTRARVSRPALEVLLARYEQAAESRAYSETLRGEAREQATLIRQRLEQGDFRVGDRLYIRVEEYAELTDTFSVAADQTIVLPGVGELELAGVLRSELQGRVTSAVERIIRNPRVRTRPLVRISIDGGVTAPGYYLVDSDAPLSDVLMTAGGHTRDAKLEDARIDRGDETVVSSERFTLALRNGTTVDHLGLRDGDRLFVPVRRGNLLTVARDLIFIIPAALGLLSLIT